MRTLVSLHDVMPDTLDAVQEQLGLFAARDIRQVTLLVVPGLEWTAQQIDRLRRWEDQGHELAGHGCVHRARHVRGPRHRVYSTLISRSAAEHLALTEQEIAERVAKCHDWFEAQGLQAPGLYVPPAWALGKADLSVYGNAGFRLVERLEGIYDLATGRMHRIPAIGFEAINAPRALALRMSNAANRQAARLSGVLRLGLHPGDLQLHLADDARAAIRAVEGALCYRDWPPLMANVSAAAGRKYHASSSP